MRKTSAFLAAFLFTASFTGSVWSVSAEETAAETEKPVAAQTQNSESKPEETSAAENTPEKTEPESTDSGENNQSETSAAETKPEENSQPETSESTPGTEQNTGEPVKEEPKEEHAALKTFVKGVTENDEQANELMNRLLAREVTAADVVRDFFSKRNYDDSEEGRKQFIADLCKYVYMNENEFEREYPAKTAFFDFGMSRDYFLMRFVLSDIFNNFCNDEGISRGNIPINENRDKNPQVTGYVQKIYNKVLGRRADTDGLNTWTGEINSGNKTAADVLAGILSSDEFRKKNTSNEDYAAILFRMCRDREADAEELKTFVESTLAKGHTREAVLRKFVRSDEFTKYCEDRKINRGDINVGGWSTNYDGFKIYVNPDTGLMERGYTTVNGIPCYFDYDGTLRTDWSDLADVIPASAQIYSYSAMEKDITKLAQQYPSLVHIRSIGRTFDGRQIYDFIIGEENAENQLVLATGMDAGEAETTRAVLAGAEKFLKNYRTGKSEDKSYEELLDGACVHIIPMRNPDGISIAQFGLDGIRSSSQKHRIRTMSLLDIKNSGLNTSLGDYLKNWKANGRGVDLILNAGAGTASKKSPCASGYPGEGKNTETELKAYDEFIKLLKQESAVFCDFSGNLKKGAEELPVYLSVLKYGSATAETAKANPSETEKAVEGSSAQTGTEKSAEQTSAEQTAPEKTPERSAFAEHLYKTVLGRDPDEDGWKYWTESLDSGVVTPFQTANIFLESRELQKRGLSDEDYIKVLFRVFCDREPSGDEMNHYRDLLSGGYSRSYAAARVTELGEYYKAFAKYGVTETESGKEGWNDSDKGRYYVQNGVRIRNDLRNLDGFTFVFDKNGYLTEGNFPIGQTTYFVKDGYIMPRNGINWRKEVLAGNLRSYSGRAQKMDIPVDYQFLYNRTICTFGGVDKHVRESGCGATSASMVMRYLTGKDDEKSDPEYLFEWAYKNGEYFGYGLAESTLSKFLESAGIKSYWIDPDAGKVTRALRAGHPVISLVREGYFTSSGHYIVLTGITRDGYVTVNDPNNSSMGRMEYRLDTVLKQAKDFMICGVSEEEDKQPEDQPKQEEPKQEEPKQEEPKQEEPKQEDPPKQTGWSKDQDGNKIYLDNDGKPVTGYTVINNINCYFDEKGVLRTDWSDLGSFVDTSSAMYTYEDMVSDINSLKSQYPSLADTKSLGTTADGRDIMELVIGKGSKQIIVHGGCHAREYMGSMLVMNQAENFLRHYWDGSYSGRSYKDLLNDYQIHIIPMLNPDGITISQKGLDGIRSAELRAGIQEIYRKDLSAGITGQSLESYLRSWKANAKGVDINRNFPVPEWADQGEIQRPSSAKYAGPSAGSETETRVVTDLVNSLPGCRAVISYHSSGSMIYWQYHQSGDFLDRCRSTAGVLHNLTGYTLLYGQNSGGGCSNWVADVKHIFACTIEIGTGDSPLNIGQYPGIWNSNKDVIPYILSAY
ncbi:M14 family zinc carboxypeptidase [Ruminococcus sp. HUN007]|uniref:M14 family zinc carboxypeptidase n=1 Tax=Ruminococcus sp. HUN007 TaxID=1514668 RepID=UPI0006799CB2|nr:M14 family zinc carboxypeptidase [Ruminococcus sp. HUN007]